MPQSVKEFLATNPMAAEPQIMEWMNSATDEDLRECLSRFAHNQKLAAKAAALLEARREALASKRHAELLEPPKPHWTFAPTFWVTVVILIVAVLAWLFPREPRKDSPTSAPASSSPATSTYIPTPPTNAAAGSPGSPVAGGTSQPATSSAPTPNP